MNKDTKMKYEIVRNRYIQNGNYNSLIDIEINRRSDRWTDIQIDRPIHISRDIETQRQIDRETERQRDGVGARHPI